MNSKVKGTLVIVLGVLIGFLLFVKNKKQPAQIIKQEPSIIEKDDKVTYLSDLEPISADSEYTKDQDREGKTIDLKDQVFKKGLCVNSESELIYKIDGKYSGFKAVVGNDSSYAEYTGKLTFIVYADEKKVYESKPLGQADIKNIAVGLNNAQEITLKISDNGESSGFAVWADAYLF